ncbi:MAG: single-stranded DNA-binding protein [Acidobacteriaceae bacterium]
MALFKNTVKLRGFLGADAQVLPSDHIESGSYVVLLLVTMSGIWDIATNEWTPETEWHRIICPGPWFCGFTRGMKKGDYVEIVGELRWTLLEGGTNHADRVHAIHIRRLDRPLVVVDTGEDG